MAYLKAVEKPKDEAVYLGSSPTQAKNRDLFGKFVCAELEKLTDRTIHALGQTNQRLETRQTATALQVRDGFHGSVDARGQPFLRETALLPDDADPDTHLVFDTHTRIVRRV